MTKAQQLIIKKSGFLLYLDQQPNIERLDNEEAGILLKAIYTYANGFEIDEKFNGNRALEQVFISIKNTLIRDSLKYEETCIKNKENASKRWEKHRELRGLCDGIQTHANYADRDRERESDKDINSEIKRDSESSSLVDNQNYNIEDIRKCFDKICEIYPYIRESKEQCFIEYKKLINDYNLEPLKIETYVNKYINYLVSLGFIRTYKDSTDFGSAFHLEDVLKTKLIDFINEHY